LNAEPQDAGHYKCQASNHLGMSNTVRTIVHVTGSKTQFLTLKGQLWAHLRRFTLTKIKLWWLLLLYFYFIAIVLHIMMPGQRFVCIVFDL